MWKLPVPRPRRSFAIIPSLVQFLFGIPGYFETGKTWVEWLMMIDASWQWWNYLLVFFGTLMFFYATAPQRVLDWITSFVGLRQDVSWSRQFDRRCEDILFRVDHIIGFDSRAMPNLMTELRIFCSDLDQYKIPYPPVSERYRVKGDNRVDSAVRLWGKYLLILRTCAQQGDLKRARNIYDELSRSDQDLWKRMDEAAEALADSE